MPRPRSPRSAGRRSRSRRRTLALQWAPTDALLFNLDVIYAKLDADFDRYTNNLLVRNTTSANRERHRLRLPSRRAISRIDGNNTLTHGTLLNAKFWSENRLFEQESDFRHVGLGGSWQIGGQPRAWHVKRPRRSPISAGA